MSRAAHLAALLGLPALGPYRVRALLDHFGDPEAAWEAVARGRLDHVPLRAATTREELISDWRRAAQGVDVEAIEEEHRTHGIELLEPEDPRWPPALVDDPEPPPMLFVAGEAGLASAPSVAIVGTRRCSAAGTALARDLGHDLSAAGVGVVSGLALGIDGAAHRGALRGGGPVIGVVATGLDVVYPRKHAALWREVTSTGVLLSEAPLGTPAERWRFPARNRLIAALASIVVVVESRATGGSMLTVDAAGERNTDVMAVPGPVRSPTSAGPNQLLADGCGVVRDATDVLVALGWTTPTTGPGGGIPVATDAPDAEASSSGPDDPVARSVSWTASSLDEIAVAAELPFATVAARLAALELDGLVERVRDGYRRVAR